MKAKSPVSLALASALCACGAFQKKSSSAPAPGPTPPSTVETTPDMAAHDGTTILRLAAPVACDDPHGAAYVSQALKVLGTGCVLQLASQSADVLLADRAAVYVNGKPTGQVTATVAQNGDKWTLTLSSEADLTPPLEVRLISRDRTAYWSLPLAGLDEKDLLAASAPSIPATYGGGETTYRVRLHTDGLPVFRSYEAPPLATTLTVKAGQKLGDVRGTFAVSSETDFAGSRCYFGNYGTGGAPSYLDNSLTAGAHLVVAVSGSGFDADRNGCADGALPDFDGIVKAKVTFTSAYAASVPQTGEVTFHLTNRTAKDDLRITSEVGAGGKLTKVVVTNDAPYDLLKASLRVDFKCHGLATSLGWSEGGADGPTLAPGASFTLDAGRMQQGLAGMMAACPSKVWDATSATAEESSDFYTDDHESLKATATLSGSVSVP